MDSEIYEFTTPDAPEEREREALFSVNGEVYSIVTEFTAAEALTFVDSLRKYGIDAATSWALEYALGAEGAQALLVVGSFPENDALFRSMVNRIVTRLSRGKYGVDLGKDRGNLQSSPISPKPARKPATRKRPVRS
jgi:hypothetical protein